MATKIPNVEEEVQAGTAIVKGAQRPKKIVEKPMEGMPDPWTEMVTINIPRYRKGEDQTVRVKVNDREVILPRDGRMHEVARPFAEVLLASVEQEANADDFMDEQMDGNKNIGNM